MGDTQLLVVPWTLYAFLYLWILEYAIFIFLLSIERLFTLQNLRRHLRREAFPDNHFSQRE